jgi:hypothetical protein
VRKKISFIFTLLSFTCWCQSDFNGQLNFLFHLSENKLIDDAVYYGNKLLKDPQYSEAQKDSVNYFLGKLLLNSSADSLAPDYLQQISINSPFYYFGRFSTLELLLKQKKAKEAMDQSCLIDSSTSDVINELITFEKAGLYLYTNQQKKFDSLSVFFHASEPDLKAEELNLLSYANINRNLKRRSPFVAGALSTLVPGLGKVYAGNNGQAIASFLSVAFLGGITAENYIKQGIKHPQTIIFGVLTSIFYIGNIWGSAIGVQLVKNEKNLENKSNILVALRIPLRRFFK